MFTLWTALSSVASKAIGKEHSSAPANIKTTWSYPHPIFSIFILLRLFPFIQARRCLWIRRLSPPPQTVGTSLAQKPIENVIKLNFVGNLTTQLTKFVLLVSNCLSLNERQFEKLKDPIQNKFLFQLDGRLHYAKFSKTAGGVARNICEALGKLGCQPKFLTVVGDDDDGHFLTSTLPPESLKTALVLPKQNTAHCTIVLDAQGDCRFLIGDMSIHERITPEVVSGKW